MNSRKILSGKAVNIFVFAAVISLLVVLSSSFAVFASSVNTVDKYEFNKTIAYAVTTAVADYAKYDLASVKGYILSEYDTDSSAEIRSLRKQINAATTMEDVESILYAYVAEYGDNKVNADALNAYAIYDFARLASLN